jgi:esterase/lipase superfamily enzyme
VSPPAPVASAPPPPAVPAPAPVPAAAPPAADPRFDVVPVFYGTDRARETRDNRIVYTQTRANQLELGHAEVTVPKSHEVPNVERPWAIRVPFTSIVLFQQAEDPARHFTIRKLATATEEDFLAFVRARLAAARTFADHATVFIHGYNTTFDFALYRTAQIAYDLKFDGAPFMYSWPAAGGVASYIYDRDSADIAEPHLRAFFELVIAKSGAKNVSVIAHSMGNRPLMRVLRDIAPRLPAGVKLDQVILASPDIDTTLFMQLAAALPTVARGATLYASSNDRAMAASRLFGGAVRAGDVPADGPVIVPGVDTIDVSSVSIDVLAMNHSLFAERTTLIEDMGRLIGSGVRPPEVRLPLIERITTPRGDYWRIP